MSLDLVLLEVGDHNLLVVAIVQVCKRLIQGVSEDDYARIVFEGCGILDNGNLPIEERDSKCECTYVKRAQLVLLELIVEIFLVWLRNAIAII